jgi:hypothetical protein
MAIRFKKEPDTEQQQFEKWNNSQFTTIANTDKQEFSNPRSKRSPVFRQSTFKSVNKFSNESFSSLAGMGSTMGVLTFVLN